MSLIVALIVGGIIGWLAAQMMGREEGLLGSVGIGVVGALIGGAFSNMIGDGSQAYTAFTWSGVVWSFIGAIVFAAILNGLQHRSSHV